MNVRQRDRKERKKDVNEPREECGIARHERRGGPGEDEEETD